MISHVGFPIGACVMLAWGVWKTLNYVAVNLLKPLIDKHIAFLDSTIASQSAQTEMIKAIAEKVGAGK